MSNLLVLGALLAVLVWTGSHARAQEYYLHLQHEFSAPQDNLSTPSVSLSQSRARPGQILTVGAYWSFTDLDYCTRGNEFECEAQYRTFVDSTHLTFSANGGELGILDGFGQFQSLAPGQFPTHFRCGNPGSALVAASIDDEAVGYMCQEGAYAAVYSTFNDDPLTGSATVLIEQHAHAWTTGSPLAAPTLTVPTEVVLGSRVPVSVTHGDDYDACTADNCTFYYGLAANAVRVSGWEGGTFGYFDPSGQWTPSSDPSKITHWEAPTQPGYYTVRAEVDDVPSAVDDEGATATTFDDPPVSDAVSVHVYDPWAHTHEFGSSTESPIEPPSVSFAKSSARPGSVVGLNVYFSEFDSDRCKNQNGNCRWQDATIYDHVHSTFTAAGGELGTTNAAGAFQPLGPGEIPTQFRCGPDPGTGSVTITLDDAAQATDPITGEQVSTYDDAPVFRTATLQVAVHQHSWAASNNLPAPVLSVSSQVAAGERVSVSVLVGADSDTCTAENCSFSGGVASNQVRVSAWLGGDFGYFDGSGQWIPTTNAALITHWQAPTAVGDYTVRVETDDVPSAVDDDGNPADTYDDPLTFATASVHVYDPNVQHTHTFGRPDDPTLELPTISFERSTARPGRVVALSVYFSQTDLDRCKNEDGSCPWWGGAVYDAVHASYTASGGELGVLDGSGQFQPLGPGQSPTHFRCGPAVGTGSVTVTLDDDAHATDPITGNPVDTYDDSPVTRTATLQIAEHQHQWDGDNLTPGSVSGETSPETESVVWLSVSAGSDWDYCSASDCPFEWGASNPVRPVSWSGAGQFGYLEAGQFVPTTGPALVTCWKAPATAGDVTLTVAWDDLPEAQNPETGAVEATHDDAPVSSTLVMHVHAPPPPHQHTWEVGYPLPAPYILTPGAAHAGEVIPISVGAGSSDRTDLDECTASGCTFPYGYASNDVAVSNWSDNGAGGTFGYLVNGTEFVATTNWPQVTHYRCPGDTGQDRVVTLTAKLDDVWQGVPDPVSGQPVDTFNDVEQSGTANLVVTTTVHQHNWTHNGNTAWQTTTLYRNGAATRAVYRGEILEVRLGEIHPDEDYCTAQGCPFPSGHAVEIPELHRTTKLDNDCGGTYGMLVGGEFIPLDPTDVAHITHFLVPLNTSTTIHLFSWIDDAGLAPYLGGSLPMNGEPVPQGSPTEKEAPTPAGNNSGGRVCVTVGDGPFACRALSGDDGCGCPTCNKVRALSAIDPQSGAVSFEVPVTGWTYRGSQLGLTLHYNSDAKADPRLEGAAMPNVQAQASRAGLSSRNSRWTHSWAQFVEVVSDGAELHALWHTGNGGAVGFLGAWDALENAYTWAPTDSVHTMLSSGTASITYQTEVSEPTGNALVPTTMRVDVPYGRFVVTDGAGTRYTFDQVHWETGRGAAIPYFLLKQVKDRWNRTVNVTWNSDGLPTSVKDGDLHGLDFTYQDRLLRSVTDPQGKTHNLSYTDVSSGIGEPGLPPPPSYPKLTGVTVRGPGSPNRVDYQWSFDYGSPSDKDTYYGGSYTGDLVIRKTEPSGKYVHYVYEGVNTGRGSFADWDGRVVRSWYVDGTEGNRVKEYRREGNALVFPGGDRTTYTFQGHDLVAVHDDIRNREVGYTYDGYHNLTSVSLNGVTQGTIAYTYAADNRTIVKARATNALGDATETEFTTWGRPVRYTAFHRPTGGQPYDLKTEWLYNNTGVGDLARTIVYGQPGTVETLFAYNAATAPGAPSSVTDYLGRVWSTEYDSLGRPNLSRTPPNPLASTGNPDQNPSVGTVQYNADGLPSLLTDPLDRQVQVTYNGIGGGQLEITTSQVGVPDSARTLVLDRGGHVVKVTDANGVETLITYNGDGQVLTVREASNKTVSHLTQYEYDLHGNLIALTPPKGAAHTVRFEYVRCNPQGVADPNGIYEGQVTRIVHPDWNAASGLGQELFGYDPATGLLAWTSRPYSSGGSTLFAQTTLHRDALYRVTQVDHPQSPQNVAGFSTSATYDEFGRTQTVTDSAGTTSYTYDALGRVRKITPSGRRELTIGYFEDYSLHRAYTRVSLYGVNGFWESREDPKGRSSGVVNPFGQEFSYEYNAAGQPLFQYNANNTKTRYLYDVRGRLSRLTHFDRVGGILDDFAYTHDDEGRLTQELDGQLQAHNFAYDDFGQLVREEHPDLPGGLTRYFYDANGNRTDVQRGSGHEYYGVDAADKLLWTNTAANSAPTANQSAPYNLFTYDDFGQLSRRDRKDASGRKLLDFKWDGDGRLRTVQNASPGNTLFTGTYTADGERVEKSDSAGGFRYHFGLFDEATAYGGASVTHTPGLAARQNGADRFFHSDWLGSTRTLSDINGGLDPSGSTSFAPYRKRFDAYGLQTAFAGPDSPNAVAAQYAGATGYQRDAGDLGLDYLYQRYYDPAIGRFVTRDPIGWAGGLNLYGYTENDPVNGVDPTGLMRDEDIVALTRMTGEAAGSWAGAYLGGSIGGSFGGGLGGAAGLTLGSIAPGAGNALGALGGLTLGQAGGAIIGGSIGVAGGRYMGRTIGEAIGVGLAQLQASTTAYFSTADPCPKVGFKNGWRTPDGKFASPEGGGKPGGAAVDEIRELIKSKSWEIIDEQATFINSSGARRVYDFLVKSPLGRLIGIEVKSGSAMRSVNQRVFDNTLNSGRGNVATGVGRNLGTTVTRSLLMRR